MGGRNEWNTEGNLGIGASDRIQLSSVVVLERRTIEQETPGTAIKSRFNMPTRFR